MTEIFSKCCQSYSDLEAVLLFIIGFLMIIMILLGNLLVIIAVIKDNTLKNLQNWFIGNIEIFGFCNQCYKSFYWNLILEYFAWTGICRIIEWLVPQDLSSFPSSFNLLLYFSFSCLCGYSVRNCGCSFFSSSSLYICLCKIFGSERSPWSAQVVCQSVCRSVCIIL